MNEPPVQCFTCGGLLTAYGACPNPKCSAGDDIFDTLAKSIEDRALDTGLTLKQARRAFAKEFSGCRVNEKRSERHVVPFNSRRDKRNKRKRRRRRAVRRCDRKRATEDSR